MNKKITVLVTGVFDLLHVEHINFLKKAKELGDLLIVGVESDIRVKQMKGEERPIQNQNVRIKNILDLRLASKVFLLPKNIGFKVNQVKLIKKIMPDILAVSSHTVYLDRKREVMKKVGGRVKIVYQYNPRISTSLIIKSQKLLQ